MQIGNMTIKPGQLYIGMAVVMALMCGLIMKGGLSSKPSSDDKPLSNKAQKPEPTTQVVVAAYPVHAGEILQQDQLQVVDWPVKLLPIGHTFQDLSNLVGKAIKADVFQGEPVFREKLASAQATGGLPVLIPMGLRAVTIAVSEVKGVAGFIKPGDKVDVLATFDLQENNRKDQITRTVLQNVLVIATAQEMARNQLPKPEDVPELEARKNKADETAQAETGNSSKDKPKTEENDKTKKDEKKSEDEDKKKDAEDTAKLVPSITLALTATQAEKLTLAEDTGNIRLILRADNDTESRPTAGIRQSQLIGRSVVNEPDKKPVLTLPAYKPRYTVEVIEGTNKRAQNF